ncbi:MAG: autoinducer binding domain-containing protein [Rhodocyclaceae bacterium]|nr:autoinducer binding domain-containing protein [Rhodocyclaceae bacterium]
MITDARSPGEVISLFREAVVGLGADAGYFLSCLRDDATRTSFRSFWACDPAWPAEYASQRWFEHDPWLRYASCDAEPTRASYLPCTSPEENAFIRAAAEHGFASALIAPAPSSVGLSRVGVLCLGSADPRGSRAKATPGSGYWHARSPWSCITRLQNPCARNCSGGGASQKPTCTFCAVRP